jgi:hypothetical protein
MWDDDHQIGVVYMGVLVLIISILRKWNGCFLDMGMITETRIQFHNNFMYYRNTLSQL